MTISTKKSKKTTLTAHQIFFPAAALFAAIGPWLLVSSLAGRSGLVMDFATHSRSLLFGYTSALIAGYLIGKLKPLPLAGIFSLWLMGRFAEIFNWDRLLANVSYSLFGLMLVLLVAPKFLSAKKWRNIAMAPLILVIGMFPLLYFLADRMRFSIELSMHSFLLLITLLMFFMGGRLITPAVSRALSEGGPRVRQNLQPRLEATTMILLGLGAALSLTALAEVWLIALTMLAGVLILLRLYRWRLFSLGWNCGDVFGFGLGYMWLGVGLLTYGLSLQLRLSIISSVHIVTIGALGTLSATIMLRLSGKNPAPPVFVYHSVLVLINTSLICRLLTDFIPGWRQLLLDVAASAWGVCFTIVFIYTSRYLFRLI